MRKFLSLIVLSGLFFMSCSNDGEVGPRGPQGPPGEDGLDAPLTTIFEIESDFEYISESNLWSTGFITFSNFSDVEVFETDVVLIYRLNGIGELDDGSEVDEWSLLPQNFFTNDGTIQYVYNHTFVDAEIFIDGNYDLGGLSNDFTQSQVFRVAIIPADFYNAANLDTSNLNSLMKSLDMNESDIYKLNSDF